MKKGNKGREWGRGEQDREKKEMGESKDSEKRVGGEGDRQTSSPL